MAAALLAVALTVPVPGAGAQTGDEAAEATVAALSTEDLETIARLETYLNRITTLRARFVQVSSNGAVAEGDLYLSRPGRLRFEYDPPHPALLIANGVNLLYYDRDLEQASFLPLWETPLSFLLRERVDLSEGGIEVLAVERGLAVLRVVLRDPETGGEGELSLLFAEQPIALKAWEIVDAQGITTQVALLDAEIGAEIDRKIFQHGDLTARSSSMAT
jgi:outer membrane lipoprotein-sorting protein